MPKHYNDLKSSGPNFEFSTIYHFLGRDNYLLKWRGPFKRSDAEKRYPANMEADTKRLVLNVKQFAI